MTSKEIRHILTDAFLYQSTGQYYDCLSKSLTSLAIPCVLPSLSAEDGYKPQINLFILSVTLYNKNRI